MKNLIRLMQFINPLRYFNMIIITIIIALF
jgi:hypothetical protein